MSNSRFNPLTIVVVVAGLSAGLITANLILEPESAPEVHKLGELPETNSRLTHLPPISLPDVTGEERSVSEWYGRPVIVNFWATWCAPCRREMPLLQLAHDARGEKGPVVIGIAADRPEDVQSYVAESGYTYPILVGEQAALELSEEFGLEFLGLPFTVFAAADGEVLRIHVGEITAEQLDAYLEVYRHLGMGHMHVDVARSKMEAI